jgi:hypothetical protein
VSQRLEVTHAIEARHRRVMTAATFHRVVAVGELLVEVMRTELDSPLTRPGDLVGPFPSGAAVGAAHRELAGADALMAGLIDGQPRAERLAMATALSAAAVAHPVAGYDEERYTELLGRTRAGRLGPGRETG